MSSARLSVASPMNAAVTISWSRRQKRTRVARASSASTTPSRSVSSHVAVAASSSRPKRDFERRRAMPAPRRLLRASWARLSTCVRTLVRGVFSPAAKSSTRTKASACPTVFIFGTLVAQRMTTASPFRPRTRPGEAGSDSTSRPSQERLMLQPIGVGASRAPSAIAVRPRVRGPLSACMLADRHTYMSCACTCDMWGTQCMHADQGVRGGLLSAA